jgi:hypothetical protein
MAIGYGIGHEVKASIEKRASVSRRRACQVRVVPARGRKSVTL